MDGGDKDRKSDVASRGSWEPHDAREGQYTRKQTDFGSQRRVTEYRLIVREALLNELQRRLEALYAYAKGYMDGHELVRQMTNIRTRFQQALREGEKRLEDMLFYWEGVQERLGQAGRLAAEMTRSIESLFPEEVREIEDAVKRAQEGVDSVMDEPGGAKVANITREAQRSVRGVLEGPLRRITSDCRLGVQNERGKLDSCVASIFAENAGREDYQKQVQKLIEAGGAPIEQRYAALVSEEETQSRGETATVEEKMSVRRSASSRSDTRAGDRR